MNTKKEDILLDHDYDGIRELDNDLPPWWLYLFYFTVAFSVVYMVHYHISNTGPSQAEEFMMEMNPENVAGSSFGYRSPYYKSTDSGPKSAAAIIAEASRAEADGMASDIEALPELEVLTDAASLENGKAIYTANCFVCHGINGEGTIGPNFTDQYWIHGGNINDLVRTINVGVIAKGMIPWDKTLTPEQIHNVASYILSLQGTNPPNGKAPEGELYTGL
ncbi:MAG: c-type cytochrome [Candidatus Marinimicrobia bacterium]|nr:c-type cytochrome [Candidatus Neomarinimicrobiota bacterium]